MHIAHVRASNRGVCSWCLGRFLQGQVSWWALVEPHVLHGREDKTDPPSTNSFTLCWSIIFKLSNSAGCSTAYFLTYFTCANVIFSCFAIKCGLKGSEVCDESWHFSICIAALLPKADEQDGSTGFPLALPVSLYEKRMRNAYPTDAVSVGASSDWTNATDKNFLWTHL